VIDVQPSLSFCVTSVWVSSSRSTMVASVGLRERHGVEQSAEMA
jgi:hypothetical protein